MNTINKILALVSLGVFMGCGGEPPPGVPSDVVADAGTTSDSSAPADSGPGRDAVTPPSDRPGPGDAAVEVCSPTIRNGERFMCVGAAMCRPNDLNPTCEGALGCTCDGAVTPYETQLICNGNSACEGAVRQMIPNLTCSPGHNRCSVNLPDGVEYAPFFDQDGSREVLFNILTRYHWYRFEGGMAVGDPRIINTGTSYVYTPSGLVQLCLWAETGCLECVGNTCYSRRSMALRTISDSFEIRFVHQCRFEVLRFSPGSDEPTFRAEVVAVPCQP